MGSGHRIRPPHQAPQPSAALHIAVHRCRRRRPRLASRRPFEPVCSRGCNPRAPRLQPPCAQAATPCAQAAATLVQAAALCLSRTVSLDGESETSLRPTHALERASAAHKRFGETQWRGGAVVFGLRSLDRRGAAHPPWPHAASPDPSPHPHAKSPGQPATLLPRAMLRPHVPLLARCTPSPPSARQAGRQYLRDGCGARLCRVGRRAAAE